MIFSTRILRVSADLWGTREGGVSIDAPSVRDLLRENEGRKEFVRSILETLGRGRVYDDSSAGEGVYVFYLPLGRLTLDGSVQRLLPGGMLRKGKVVVEVQGGVAEATEAPDWVEVEIRDHDVEEIEG